MLQKNAVRAVFIDIDGTLIAPGNPPSEFDVTQLRKLKQQGDMVFLNTGRSFGYIPQYLREADYIDGVIAGGGAHIVWNGISIYRRVVEENILCEVSELYLAIGKWCLFEGEEGTYEVFRNGVNMAITHKDDFMTRYKGARVSKITMEGEVTEREREVLHPHFYIFKHNGYSEGFIRGESKTSGIERILHAIGIDKKQTVGIGDSVNDIEMLINTEFGIAMGNACQELKQIADVITDDCTQSGLGKAIVNHLLRT